MVGIAGAVGLDHDEDLTDLINRMVEHHSISGEEQTDYWSGGRLSIARTHLGVTETEPQPIFGEDRSACIVMTGNVFNAADHRESLLDAGYEFGYEDNDAEVCLNQYLEHGVDGFRDLNGTFSMVIFDRNRDEVVIVNDRFSSEPIFYHQGDSTFVFDRFAHSILESEDVPKRLDKRAILEFFTVQRTFGDRTFYEDIRMLPPASVVHIDGESVDVESYWEPEYDLQDRPMEEFVEEMADRIVDATARRISPDLKTGLFLSGGLDSRALLAAFKILDEPVQTFSFSGRRYLDEDLRVAKKAAAAANVDHRVIESDTELIDPATRSELVDLCDGMNRIDHGPMRDYVTNVTGVDVAFHGLEMDYTIGGTFIRSKQLTLFRRTFPLPIMEDDRADDIESEIWRRLDKLGFSDLGAHRFFDGFSAEDLEFHIRQTIRESMSELAGGVDNVNAAFEHFCYSPAYKSHVHLNNSAVSAYMPTRLIVYDNDLFSLYLSIPPKIRYNRRLLSKVIERLNPALASVTNSNTGYPVDMSRTTTWLFQAKDAVVQGIVDTVTGKEDQYTGMGQWIRESSAFQDLLLDVIRDEDAIDPEIFDIELMERCFEQHMAGERDNYDPLLKILTFGLWHRKYGPTPSVG